MPAQTDRLKLPLLEAGQAQKEVLHNEAITAIDLLLQNCIEDSAIDTPPAEPSPGQCWIVGGGPTGAWAGHADEVAAWTGGGWRFFQAQAGMAFWHAAEQCSIAYNGTEWVTGEVRAKRIKISGLQIVGSQHSAVLNPAGGAFIDAEARASIGGILNALRSHGLIAT